MSDIAPIKQILLTVQFEPAMVGLNILHLAGLRSQFTASHPIFNQVTRGGPMGSRPDSLNGITEAGMPRIQMLSIDLTWEIMFQEDRISVGWNRTTPVGAPSNYPGFEAVAAQLLDAIGKVRSFLILLNSPTFVPTSGEIAYTDRFAVRPTNSLGTTLTNIFTVFEPSLPLDATAVNCAWMSDLKELDFQGYMQTAITGPETIEDGQAVITMQSSAHFDLRGLGWDSLEHRFLQARSSVGHAFRRLVKPSFYAMLDA